MKAPLMRLCLLLVTSGAIVPPATAQVVQPRPTVRAAITVTSPKTGDRLSVGRTTPIRGSSTGVLSRAVDIALVESQREVGVIARGVPNSGIYDWAVPRMQRP